MEAYRLESLRAALRQSGRCGMQVGGQSMRPLLRPDDRIELRAGPRRPSLGMVVAVKAGNRVIVHRVQWVRSAGPRSWDVWVAGDSSPGSVSKVCSDDILGYVDSLIRSGRRHRLRFRFPFRLLALPLGVCLRTVMALKVRLSLR